MPILRYVLGIDAHRAIAMSLLVVGTTSLAALIPHARRGCVEWRTGLVFGSAGMIGAYLAGTVAHAVPAPILLVGFGSVMVATALAMLRAPTPRCATEHRSRGKRSVPLVLVEGLAVGAVTGFVGAGGGFLVVPALVLLGKMPMNLAIGTSLLVVAMKSFAGLAGFLGHTPIDWSLALPISASALTGSMLGSALSSRIRPEALRQGFGWFVVAMAFFVLGQELPPLSGHAPSLALAIAASVFGTSSIVALRWVVRKRARRVELAARPSPRPGPRLKRVKHVT